MKKTIITKCGEELLGPQASLRVTPCQPVLNHTKGAFWFSCLLYFFPDYHHVLSFFFFVFPSFMSSYTFGPLWYFSDTVLVRVSCLFFSFFFLFFLFFLELGIISFSLFMLLLLLFFFFKFSHLKLHDNVFLGCFIFRPYVIKLEQYEVVSKRFLSASPFFSTFEIELEFWKVDQQFDSTPFSIFRMVVKKVANFFMNF